MYKKIYKIIGLILFLFSVILFVASLNRAAAQGCFEGTLPEDLILMTRYYDVGNNKKFDTKIKYSQYHCITASWNGRFDPNEDYNPEDESAWSILTYKNPDTKTWWADVRMPSDDRDDENPDVDIVCFSDSRRGTDIVTAEGSFVGHHPD